jgi:hypothetical protein
VDFALAPSKLSISGACNMDSFSFVFSLFGLLLGLALAEVLGGFGNVLQERRKLRIGWQTPLLGVLVALDITSFWTFAWTTKNAIPPRYIALFVGLLFTGTYYLIARLVFPRDFKEWPDLDIYYAEHKRWVLGGVLLLNLVAMGISALLGVNPWQTWLDMTNLVAFFPVLVAAILIRGRRANVALLAWLSLLYPVDSLIAFLTVPGI